MKNYKVNRKLITVKCDYCGQNHEKPKSEYLRNSNLGRKNYCSRTCVGKTNFKNFGDKLNRNTEHLKVLQHTNPFKYYLKGAKNRFQECSLDIEILKLQWEKQNGICPYSGIKLILSTHKNPCKNKIYAASLDRINSSMGYHIGNIQFVSQCINFMKNTMTHEETIEMCKIIADNWN